MQLIKFRRGNGEVLIDPEKVSHIEANRVPSWDDKTEGLMVRVSFGGTNERIEFVGEDAKNVRNYFTEFFLTK